MSTQPSNTVPAPVPTPVQNPVPNPVAIPVARNAPGSQSRRVARNLLMTFGTQIVSTGLAFVVTLFLTHYIKAKGNGIYGTAGAFSAILSVLVSLGTSKILVREIAQDRERLGSLVAASITMRIILGLIALGVGGLALLLFPCPSSLKPLIFLGFVGMPITQIVDVLTCALTGVEEFKWQNAVMLTDKILSSVAIITLVLLRAPLWEIISVGIVTVTIDLILLLVAVRRHIHRQGAILQWKIDPAQIRFLLMASTLR